MADSLLQRMRAAARDWLCAKTPSEAEASRKFWAEYHAHAEATRAGCEAALREAVALSKGEGSLQ